MKESFFRFAGQVRPGGKLIINRELENEFKSMPGKQIYTYSLQKEADYYATDLKIDPVTRCYTFSIRTPSELSEPVEMRYPGLLNVENGVAAAAASHLAGATLAEIKNGLEQYTGVKRRFDIRYQSWKSLFIDDYAHHPKELSAFIRSVRLLYPGEKITGIFQPHLYTRTRDFAEEFAESLDLLDSCLLLPVYPARELPIEGVNTELIMSYMKSGHKKLVRKSEIPAYIRKNKPAILLTMGAGDIELLADVIIAALKDEKND
jgi:UDP-N-acetylmuramate--alanine ligase